MLLLSSHPAEQDSRRTECFADSGARVLEAEDRERRRLERDLHDGAQLRLVSLALRLGTLAMRFEPGSETDRLLSAARAELAAALTELRDVAHGIHPAVLTAHGLAAALDSLAARAPLPVDVYVDIGRRLPAAVELAAYYVVAEALTNIAKHAHADSATVRASVAGRRLVLEIADDGAGRVDLDAGTGLRGLVDRVEALGGSLRVESAPGEGTRVRVVIPCAPAGLHLVAQS